MISFTLPTLDPSFGPTAFQQTMIEKEAKSTAWVRLFCNRLARRTKFSNLLDWVASHAVKLPAAPQLAYVAAPGTSDFTATMSPFWSLAM
jgi:hypothetical protein